MRGNQGNGKRLGIIDAGRIGQLVARRARGFGPSIHYHNRHRVHAYIKHALETTYCESLDQMLARMDMLSVNYPHTPATFHLLPARRLKLIQSHAYIVNTACGEVINEIALTQLLISGQLAAAGLDVFKNDPAVNPKLLCSTTTSIFCSTLERSIDTGDKVIVNIKTFTAATSHSTECSRIYSDGTP